MYPQRVVGEAHLVLVLIEIHGLLVIQSPHILIVKWDPSELRKLKTDVKPFYTLFGYKLTRIKHVSSNIVHVTS